MIFITFLKRIISIPFMLAQIVITIAYGFTPIINKLGVIFFLLSFKMIKKAYEANGLHDKMFWAYVGVSVVLIFSKEIVGLISKLFEKIVNYLQYDIPFFGSKTQSADNSFNNVKITHYNSLEEFLNKDK